MPHVSDPPRVQWFPAGGNSSGIGGCSEVTHEAGLTLLRPLSTAKIINTVAGRLPLLVQHPGHPEILISKGPIARHPSRLPNWVRSSEPTRGSLNWHQKGLSNAPQHPCACLANVGQCSTDRRGMRILWTGVRRVHLNCSSLSPRSPARHGRRQKLTHALFRLGLARPEIARLKQFSSICIMRARVTIRYPVPCGMSLGVARGTATSALAGETDCFAIHKRYTAVAPAAV